MLPESTNQNIGKQYTEEEYHKAVERILKHNQSTLKFKSELSSAHDTILNGDYTLGRISHNYFLNCKFIEASLKSVAGVGSIFSCVSFEETNISHTGFQNSTFENCFFKNCNLESSNMSRCFIAYTSWENCAMKSMNLSGTYLKKCKIINCLSNPGNLSECYMEEVYIKDIRLTNLNLEFSEFKNIKTKDVILPFSQMPYVFGGLSYIMKTADNVRISSHINAEDSISVEEYTDVLQDMIIFYSYKKEYFPLANILLAFERYQEAFESILNGIISAARQNDFRMCKYFCKLITQNANCTHVQLNMLYQALLKEISIQELTDSQQYQYKCFIPEIREILIENPGCYPHGTLILTTNIKKIDSKKTSILLSGIDYFLHLRNCTLQQPLISISHNSPLVFSIDLCSHPLIILAISSFILSVIVNVCKGYNEIAQAIIATQTISLNNQQAKKNELEEQKLQAEIMRLEIENADLKQNISQKQQQITDSGIVIISAEMKNYDFNPYKWL